MNVIELKGKLTFMAHISKCPSIPCRFITYYNMIYVQYMYKTRFIKYYNIITPGTRKER